MSDNSNNSAGILAGLIVGAAAGAVLALLLAPASGEETRRKLGEATRRLGDEGRRRVDDARDFTTDRLGDVRTAVRAGKDAYQQARGEHTTKETNQGA